MLTPQMPASMHLNECWDACPCGYPCKLARTVGLATQFSDMGHADNTERSYWSHLITTDWFICGIVLAGDTVIKAARPKERKQRGKTHWSRGFVSTVPVW